jgi:rubredoxin
MQRFICQVCGYVYDPNLGDPDQEIAPGTPFGDLPSSWICPDCGAPTGDFSRIE